MIYPHVKFERPTSYGLWVIAIKPNIHLTLKLENFGIKVTENVQWIELIKFYPHVKFERHTSYGLSVIQVNTIMHLTLKLETFKVKVTNKACSG